LDETATHLAGAKPEEELRHDEIIRTRNFAAGTVIVGAVGMVAQWLNPRWGWLGLTSRGFLVGVILIALVVWYMAAKRGMVSSALMTLWGVVGILLGIALELDVGVFSPVIGAGIIAISFFARSNNTRLVWILFSLKVGLYFTAAMLVTFDVIADPARYSVVGAPRVDKLTLTLVVVGMYAMALVYGRSSRRGTIESITLARTAALEAARREAQLDEARGELEAALNAQRGRSGRYSGTTVDGWRIGALIGRGAMGEVYAAQDDSGTKVAMKFLLMSAVFDDPSRLARFMREAKVASMLRSRALVQVLAVGQAPDETPYFVMELLSGEDLASILRRDERLSVDDAVVLVSHIADGLRVAHEAGVVHRDLKPGNLFRDGERWKVLDFGVCTEAGSSGTLTADGVVGTPQYMAPEQANGDPVGPATDLFALGAVLYRALTGMPPFAGPSAPQLLYSIVHDLPVRPRDLVPALPADIEHVLAIALAKHPKSRFENVGELRDALRDAARGQLAAPLRAQGERASWRTLQQLVN
jgi:serine/threonine-protein kinase